MFAPSGSSLTDSMETPARTAPNIVDFTVENVEKVNKYTLPNHTRHHYYNDKQNDNSLDINYHIKIAQHHAVLCDIQFIVFMYRSSFNVYICQVIYLLLFTIYCSQLSKSRLRCACALMALTCRSSFRIHFIVSI